MISDDANPLEVLMVSEHDLAQIAVTENDWQACQMTDADLDNLALSVEEVLVLTEADWCRLGLPLSALIKCRDSLKRHLRLSPQELAWLNDKIERRQDGHTRAQTSAN